MDEKPTPTQDALVGYSILANLMRGVERLKKEPRRKQSKELKTHIRIG